MSIMIDDLLVHEIRQYLRIAFENGAYFELCFCNDLGLVHSLLYLIRSNSVVGFGRFSYFVYVWGPVIFFFLLFFVLTLIVPEFLSWSFHHYFSFSLMTGRTLRGTGLALSSRENAPRYRIGERENKKRIIWNLTRHLLLLRRTERRQQRINKTQA